MIFLHLFILHDVMEEVILDLYYFYTTINTWCNEKHGTTKRIPNQHYLLEEKQLLGVLQPKHLYQSPLKKRIVSADSFVSFEGNKYSVPVKYACKTVFVRLVFGYRLQIYDKTEAVILEVETIAGKGQSVTVPEHYEAISPKTATSIPQIRRDFTECFSNGARYLDVASRSFDQPTHHARKIMELLELYDAGTLDQAIAIAIDENCMDIKSFRMLMKEYNAGLRTFEKKTDNVSYSVITADALTRDCDYYEKLTQEAMYATDNVH